MSMFTITIGRYRVASELDQLPSIYATYRARAALCDELELNAPGRLWFLAVGTETDWPGLVVAQRFHSGEERGGDPEALLIPETDLVLLGAGQRVVAYTLRKHQRLWADSARAGFFGWRRYGDVVLMLAAGEIAAWDLRGRKLWAVPVDSPWYHHVDEQYESIQLDTRGRRFEFPLKTGPGPDAW
jgi:hypothetical protein